MIQGKLLGGRQLTEDLRAKAGALPAGLTRVITRLTMTLLRKVKEEKLTGQVLNVRSGNLRRSINSKIDGQNTLKVSGSVGTKLKYGKPHEFGFQGTVNVRESLREQKTAFGRAIMPREVTVRAHKMKMNLPERSFLRSALAEMDDQIETSLKDVFKDQK